MRDDSAKRRRSFRKARFAKAVHEQIEISGEPEPGLLPVTRHGETRDQRLQLRHDLVSLVETARVSEAYRKNSMRWRELRILMDRLIRPGNSFVELIQEEATECHPGVCSIGIWVQGAKSVCALKMRFCRRRVTVVQP